MRASMLPRGVCVLLYAYSIYIYTVYTILYYNRIVTLLQPEDLVCASGNIQSAPYDKWPSERKERWIFYSTSLFNVMTGKIRKRKRE